MRRIEVESDLNVRFPGRCSEFDDGVEVGLVAAHMAAGLWHISRTVSADAVPQIESLARSMAYRVQVGANREGRVQIEAQPTGRRPGLRVITGG